MLVTFHCNHCSAKLRINANAMGSQLNCPECEGGIDVPEMKFGPGFVVGGFLIKHKIGQGGMGEVYLATQLSLERDVALKILPSRFTRERSFLVRFLKEVHYQAKLDHPNIVTAYDAGEDNGVYFMAMAYVAGETLEEWLNREATMDEADALQIVRQVALALQYASEQKGILHRDIKPGNVMITPTLHAKVLDLGLSKNTLEKKSTTLADTLLGTPNYMSPEQIDHPQDIDTRADIFSLGMTCYHMLTGQVPFEDTSYLKTLKRHARDKLEDPRKLIPGISEGVSRLLARMLARKPDDRYEGWDDFLCDLQAVRSGGPLPELPEGETTLALAPLDPKDSVSVEIRTPSDSSTRVPERRTWNPTGIAFSVLLGLSLGLVGVLIMIRMAPERFAQTPRSEPPAPLPTPVVTPPPEPTPTPFADEAALRRRLTGIVLDYEQNPNSHDEAIRSLVELARDAKNTVIADQAAEQIIRLRREREAAVKTVRRTLREDALRILYEQGVDAARVFVEAYEEPFPEETDSLRSNLLRRIEIRERQEQSQREADEQRAEEAYSRLLRLLAPRLLGRDWPAAMEQINAAAEDPVLFPASARIGTLRRELAALQRVPDAVLESYKRQINQEVQLTLEGGPVTVEILELQPGGLVVSQTLYSEEGVARGKVERDIPFSELSQAEMMSRLENLAGDAFDLYRALLLYQQGNRLGARTYLEAAGGDLAKSVYDFLYRPLSSATPDAAPVENTPSPFSMPRFGPEPTPASP